mmetsp:Transcript_47700/g.102168  ORF Transcript_47700/g.102168 Transcript_47700/m.102168 type:complete len:684 (-) Transcript_47700:146-2197(-)
MASPKMTSRPALPNELASATLEETATLAQVPNERTLAEWLEARGVSVQGWGDGTTKSVGKLWKEIKLGEAGLELWRTNDGKPVVLRSTHVLRGKVCSQHSYERGVFLFNTWQQFSDGRKRTRNGLLSEKLNMDEIPLEEHLHEVCKRAVEEEEMCFLVEAAFVLGPNTPAPQFDPLYRCPLTVEDEKFMDYTIEVEESKSFPGLQTAYHLYTVDIICSGLPGVDFNTLEYNEPDEQGKRKLKYVHAWNWLQWPTIQRYLFEGSQLKETKRKGAFACAEDLEVWLQRHSVSTDEWGKDGHKGVGALLKEVETEETQLELWGRHDGVPLLMRVVHVLQLKVVSDDPRLLNKFLLQTWSQSRDGHVRDVSRLMSKKLTCAQVPFDEARFNKAAEKIVESQLFFLADVHFSINPASPPVKSDMSESEVQVISTRLVGMHHDIEESPSFPGLHTMYHLYTMEVECSGLPLTDFTSVDFDRRGGPFAHGWRWRTLPECLDVLHARAQAQERQDTRHRLALNAQRQVIGDTADRLERMMAAVKQLTEGIHCLPGNNHRLENARAMMAELQTLTQNLRKSNESTQEEEHADAGASLAESLPPAMLSKMAADTITSDSFFEEILAKQRVEQVSRATPPSLATGPTLHCRGSRGNMRNVSSMRAWVAEASDIPEAEEEGRREASSTCWNRPCQ